MTLVPPAAITTTLRYVEPGDSVRNPSVGIGLRVSYGMSRSGEYDIADHIDIAARDPDTLRAIAAAIVKMANEAEARLCEMACTTGTAGRMAAVMLRIAAERGHCLDLDLIDEGFSAADIQMHGTKARDIANRLDRGRAA